jgi:hypothetical protein
MICEICQEKSRNSLCKECSYLSKFVYEDRKPFHEDKDVERRDVGANKEEYLHRCNNCIFKVRGSKFHLCKKMPNIPMNVLRSDGKFFIYRKKLDYQIIDESNVCKD